VILSRLAAALAVALFCSCASTRPAPRFDVPSTAPIQQAHQQIAKHLDSAKEHTKQIESECPQAKANIAALSADLDGAYSELQTSEGARLQLDTQLKQQTDKANQVAAQLDTVRPERDAAVAKYHKLKGWFCWEGAAVVFLALLRFGNLILFFIPPPYKYIAYAALPAATYGILWLWL
jgi:Skp family chaperone for outer membrane proteins